MRAPPGGPGRVGGGAPQTHGPVRFRTTDVGPDVIGYGATMTESEPSSPLVSTPPDADPDQDADPPGSGIPGPVHSDEPVEGPDPEGSG